MKLKNKIDWRTIDEIVDWYMCGQTNKPIKDAIIYILDNLLDCILIVLKYEDNKPSKYDLLIIERISGLLSSANLKLFDHIIDKDYIEKLESILEIYKNRKSS